MDDNGDDPDLPGDKGFKPAPPVVEMVVPIRCPECPPAGRCSVCGGPTGAIAMGMTLDPVSQAAIHHNRIRYGELQKARLGMENEYARTRYR